MKKRRVIRLGGYGDPAMLPEAVVKEHAGDYDHWLGYTHQWRKRWAGWSKRYCMASVDNEAEGEKARSEGWRTFRVSYETDNLAAYFAENNLWPSDEIICPNTTHGVKCEDCGLCDGARPGDKRRSIVILAHGAKSNKHLEV